LNENAIAQYILTTFAGVETSENYGYTFFFYKSERVLPFVTLIAADNEYDQISQLNRLGVYRLNIGVGRQAFQALFGEGKVEVGAYDYAALNQIMPHPEYAAQHFVCVLSPSGETLEKVQGLLAQAYEIAVRRHEKRQPQD
jgi:hypothetical protein